MQSSIRIEPLGDRAIVIRSVSFEGESGWRRTAALADAIANRREAWIEDVVPAYETVTVVYDPLQLWQSAGNPADELPYGIAERQLRRMASILDQDELLYTARRIDIPLRYGGEDGPDLAEAAERAGLSPEAFIAAHSGAEYTVAMIGFMPGFPYLSGLPERLAQPRKEKPRTIVPAGSVGIAGLQTGIYPIETPGGWQLIGRTSFRLYDPDQEPPVLLRAGDRVRFIPEVT
ncbi:5-oxoprolinase subunit PxpB [Paenibacillus sp. NPDC058071]|uniref:5-oxoprolinase subunit PxpB n=1 Tax=Paenibacillus sp. NPDC058071 TaxID=3346326 RepID=UPI0036D90A52